MTQEEKQLLLIDLCARLPYYKIICKIGEYSDYVLCGIDLSNKSQPLIIELHEEHFPASLENVRPYLRPMSSMTEEEEKELKKIHHQFYKGGFIDAGVFSADDCGCTVFEMSSILNYLMSRNFDYCGLIEKGLALEAKPEMYKI